MARSKPSKTTSARTGFVGHCICVGMGRFSVYLLIAFFRFPKVDSFLNLLSISPPPLLGLKAGSVSNNGHPKGLLAVILAAVSESVKIRS